MADDDDGSDENDDQEEDRSHKSGSLDSGKNGDRGNEPGMQDMLAEALDDEVDHDNFSSAFQTHTTTETQRAMTVEKPRISASGVDRSSKFELTNFPPPPQAIAPLNIAIPDDTPAPSFDIDKYLAGEYPYASNPDLVGKEGRHSTASQSKAVFGQGNRDSGQRYSGIGSRPGRVSGASDVAMVNYRFSVISEPNNPDLDNEDVIYDEYIDNFEYERHSEGKSVQLGSWDDLLAGLSDPANLDDEDAEDEGGPTKKQDREVENFGMAGPGLEGGEREGGGSDGSDKDPDKDDNDLNAILFNPGDEGPGNDNAEIGDDVDNIEIMLDAGDPGPGYSYELGEEDQDRIMAEEADMLAEHNNAIFEANATAAEENDLDIEYENEMDNDDVNDMFYDGGGFYDENSFINENLDEENDRDGAGDDEENDFGDDDDEDAELEEIFARPPSLNSNERETGESEEEGEIDLMAEGDGPVSGQVGDDVKSKKPSGNKNLKLQQNFLESSSEEEGDADEIYQDEVFETRDRKPSSNRAEEIYLAEMPNFDNFQVQNLGQFQAEIPNWQQVQAASRPIETLQPPQQFYATQYSYEPNIIIENCQFFQNMHNFDEVDYEFEPDEIENRDQGAEPVSGLGHFLGEENDPEDLEDDDDIDIEIEEQEAMFNNYGDEAGHDPYEDDVYDQTHLDDYGY